MKADSVGLETDIHLSEEEISRLKVSALEGDLTFREVNEDKTKRIPFTLGYNSHQREFLNVRLAPRKTYFGDARHITYTINDYLYTRLVESGSCGDRFWVEGKLLIYADNIK